MSEGRAVLLAAGGTGGHLFPAEATAQALRARGFRVELATDARALRYGGDGFDAIHQIRSGSPTGGSLVSKARAALALALGTVDARALLKKTRPLCVIGFGGYPTVPPLLAAAQLRAPSVLHEQNAVMGRANRFLVKRVDRLATGFARVKGVDEAVRAKSVHTGNPLRAAALAAARVPYPERVDGKLNLLVTGGSQGARVMSDVVPAAIALLPAESRARLRIVQQARGEDEARARDAYALSGAEAEVASFFADLPGRIAQAHLVVARAGASTVSELAAIGRPCILVPFPFAIDQDQAANAAELAATGAAQVTPQTGFTPDFLAKAVIEALDDPDGLTRRAEAAKSAGVIDAADRLAELVAALIAERTPQEGAR